VAADRRHRQIEPPDETPALLFALTLAAAPAFAQNAPTPPAAPTACVAAGAKDIANLFDRWNASLKAGDPEAVVRDNYAQGSVLLPTVEDGPYAKEKEKVAYFRLFLKKEPIGKIVDRASIEVDCNTAVDTGLYDFTYKDGTVVHARYTFTYRWFGAQHAWLITSHHSSALPAE
jgi:hypothetical protein